MGLMNIFSKKKEEPKVETQEVENYYTPVVEPVGELPVGGEHISKFIPDNISEQNNNLDNTLIFEDEVKPTQILTTEQKELADNGLYLTPTYLSEQTQNINPVVNSFLPQDDYSDSLDDELPYDDDEDVFNSNVDGSYSSVSSQNYEDDRVNEHKFFSSSVDDIDNYKKQISQSEREKQKIYGDANIFFSGRIDDRK